MHEQAINYSNNSLELFKNNFMSLSPSMPNEIMLKHKEKLVSIWNKTSNILIERLDNSNNYYTQWLSLNGLLSINLNRLDNDIELSPLVKNRLDSIRNIKQELNRQIENIANSDVKEIYDLKDSLLVMELILKNYYMDNSKISRNYNSNISFLLNEQAVLVDIVKIPVYDFKNSTWLNSSNYMIFITDSKDTLVDYILIKDGIKMDQNLFDQYRQEATDPDRKTDLTSDKFYNYFWKPIADKIGDAKTVYVSLGGVYNNINLNTIYNPTTGKYLLEEKDIRIVNSAREFILNKERETKTYTNNTASLFGFPNFDGNTTVSVDSSDLFASTRDLNSFWLDSLTRGGLKAKPLPATKTEVENISATLKSKGWQVTNYLADNASETNLKTQQSPRVLHVATHGYFFPDIPMEDKDQTRFLGMDRQQVAQDPMLRSGLLLTGANRTLKGEVSTGENGLLSAAEASLLDLRETELVVLSACETGKGEVKNSEGVYGLRKAFSDAGAQNIIMSLWKVDDKVTQEFMTRFYQLWLNDNTAIREAFHKTQLEIKAKYPQPYYWGAFILVGE